MKTFIILLSFFSLSSVYAKCPADISGSGRLWPSPVKEVILHNNGCRVIPTRGQTDADPFCPLDDSGVISRGIEVGSRKGVCNYKVGDSISGNLVNVDDELMIERHWQLLKKQKEKEDLGDEKTDLKVNNSSIRHLDKGDESRPKSTTNKSSGATKK